MVKRHEDIDNHGIPLDQPSPEGSLFEYADNLPQDPHANEPESYLTQDESDALFEEGLMQERAEEDAALMHKQERTAQKISDTLRGTKSALQENGFYATGSNLKPGKYLPGFGPVTYRNHEQADAFARELNRQKKQK